MKKLEVKDLKENFFVGYCWHQREIQYNDCQLGWYWLALE